MCVHVCVCVCVCVPRESIQSCSNCEVQQFYVPTTTANHKFIACPAGGLPRRAGSRLTYSRRQHTTAHALRTRRETSRHTLHARVPYRSPHPRPMHPWEGRGGGGRGLLGTHRQDKRLRGGMGVQSCPPPASQPAANHPTMEGKEKLGKGGGDPHGRITGLMP